MSATVAVTGASGYLGTHIVEQLIAAGHRVRATARDPNNSEKTSYLRSLAAAADQLEFFKADLLKPGSFKVAFAGCSHVLHAAASVTFGAKNPQKEIVDPTVQGTKNVLHDVAATPGIERVVMTSSVAAVTGDDGEHDRVFTEDDWNETATLKASPYPLAKTQAERFAWRFVEDLPEDERFSLVTINPSFIIGPLRTKGHRRSSPSLVVDFMRGKFPAAPKFNFGMVDVREAAAAHVAALTNPEAKGRYILNEEAHWVVEIAREIKRLDADSKAPLGELPNLLLYAVALFDKRLNLGFVRAKAGRIHRFDGSRATRELEVSYRPFAESVRDMAQSISTLGLV